jgi:predicted enzyme related to lactoylglutathione lyase
MQNEKAVFKNAWPYGEDKMNLPVRDLESVIPFYEKMFGFTVEPLQDVPRKSAILRRDDIEIGFCENGGDPAQEGCFFEVDNVEAAYRELAEKGLINERSAIKFEQHGTTSWKLFYVVAPDGLCFSLGQRQA